MNRFELLFSLFSGIILQIVTCFIEPDKNTNNYPFEWPECHEQLPTFEQHGSCHETLEFY
jgi:hypothetical protein